MLRLRLDSVKGSLPLQVSTPNSDKPKRIVSGLTYYFLSRSGSRLLANLSHGSCAGGTSLLKSSFFLFCGFWIIDSFLSCFLHTHLLFSTLLSLGCWYLEDKLSVFIQLKKSTPIDLWSSVRVLEQLFKP